MTPVTPIAVIITVIELFAGFFGTTWVIAYFRKPTKAIRGITWIIIVFVLDGLFLASMQGLTDRWQDWMYIPVFVIAVVTLFFAAMAEGRNSNMRS